MTDMTDKEYDQLLDIRVEADDTLATLNEMAFNGEDVNKLLEVAKKLVSTYEKMAAIVKE